ncbi:MAG: molybdopterin-guanine dinucleotide biosynthesis protein MobB [Desulfovibrionales bacterium]
MIRGATIVGYKNSGKTTLCVQVAEILRDRGVRVGVVKFAHHSFDLEGRDTRKFSEVAHVVGGIGEAESMLIWPRHVEFSELVSMMDVDVLLVEGGKSLNCLPRIVLPRNRDEAESLDNGLVLGTFPREGYTQHGGFTSAEEVADEILQNGFVLPGLDCGRCGHDACRDLARAIVSGQAVPAECRAGGGHLTVTVNGREVAMNDFVRKVIAGSISGMLAQLKGVEPGPVRIELDMRGHGAASGAGREHQTKARD